MRRAREDRSGAHQARAELTRRGLWATAGQTQWSADRCTCGAPGRITQAHAALEGVAGLNRMPVIRRPLRPDWRATAAAACSV